MWHNLEYGRNHRPHRREGDMQNVESRQPEYAYSQRILELRHSPILESATGGSYRGCLAHFMTRLIDLYSVLDLGSQAAIGCELCACSI